MLSYVFFIFFLFFLSKSCTVVFWALQLGISNLLSQEKKKSAGEYFLVKMCQQQSGLTSFFFLFSLFLAANSSRFVCFRLFLSISSFFFFPTAITNDSFVLQIFSGFFQDYFSFFFYYSLSDFGSFSSFSSESSALPLLDLLLSSVATAFLTEWKMRFLT